MLYSIIIEPIEIVVSWVFYFFLNLFPFMGILGALFGVSMAVNFLALPLYNVADSLQEKERKISKQLEYRVKRIKKGFSGDEQFMMLSEYYRQNNYHPLYVLRSSLSILIEIPFFIAAYHFLSRLDILNSDSFWFLKSFGEPDNLFSFSVFNIHITINILPIIMTLINFVSGYIYTKDCTRKDKIQLYAMGVFFLVILYDSPSGLVIYWIFNNIFSLCKTIVLKTRYARIILYWTIGLFLFGLGVILAIRTGVINIDWIILFCFVGLLCIALSFTKKRTINNGGKSSTKCYIILFFLGVALALLCGLVIPSGVISSSPIEFSFIGTIDSPIDYVYHAFFVSLGLFVFWPMAIGKMFGKKVCSIENILFFSLLVLALSDTFFFSGSFGILTNRFFPENPDNLKIWTLLDIIGPFIIVFLSVFCFLFLEKKQRQSFIILLCISIAIGELAVGLFNVNVIKKTFESHAERLDERDSLISNDSNNGISPVFRISKTEKNVIILFLDRAVNQFFPKALEEVPDLKDQFSGFTYFPNTVSFSSSTITAAPAMMGGYEYIPAEINKRTEELLVDKHNEASVVLAKVFEDGGYDVTITDPPFPNYTWSGDLSAFNVLQNSYIDELAGKYTDKFISEYQIMLEDNPEETVKRESVNYSILQILPPVLRFPFNRLCRNHQVNVSGQSRELISHLSELYYLPDLCDIGDYGNQFLFIGNSSTHTPTYINDSFTLPVDDRSTDHLKWVPHDESTLIHYETFVASFKQIGQWLDYLKDEGVYDNTRIIIVSDHGFNLYVDDWLNSEKILYTPILLYKDFDSNGELMTDETFMTNADTPFLAMEDLGLADVNPYTGLRFDNSVKGNGLDVFLGEWDAEAMKAAGKKEFNMNTSSMWHIKPGDLYSEGTWNQLDSIQ